MPAPRASCLRRLWAVLRGVPSRLRLAQARRAVVAGYAGRGLLLLAANAEEVVGAAIRAQQDAEKRLQLYRDIVLATVAPGGILRRTQAQHGGGTGWR